MAHSASFGRLGSIFLRNIRGSSYLNRGFNAKRLQVLQRMTFATFSTIVRSRKLYAIAVPFGFVVHALSNEEKIANEQRIIGIADDLYDKTNYGELLTLLYAERESENDEILWRLARAMFEQSKGIENDKEKLAKLEEALGYVNKALEINGNSGPAHKWCAILMDSFWSYKCRKGRITHSFETRKHMEKAVELNPKDSTSYYLLGEWCYAFADLSWYKRKVASVIFATPPTSTFEEAYNYFEEAEKISPKFYSMNLLMMGKCLLKMNQKDKALVYLEEARNYPCKTPDDKKANEEASKILKDMGVNV